MEINYVNVKGEGGREEGVVSVDHQSQQPVVSLAEVGEVRMWDEQESLRSDCGARVGNWGLGQLEEGRLQWRAERELKEIGYLQSNLLSL